MKIRLSFISATLITFTGMHSFAYGQTYKCKEANGAIIYQGSPCSNSEEIGRFHPDKVSHSQNKTAKFTEKFLANVPYGISPAEVLHQLPESKSAVTTSHNVDGSQLAVEIERYPFAGKEFRVGFLFLSNRLTQVHLSDTTPMEVNDSTSSAFERISNTLRQLYGNETSRNLESRRSGLFGGAEWVQGNTRVSVDIIPMTQYHSTIVINYRAK